MSTSPATPKAPSAQHTPSESARLRECNAELVTALANLVSDWERVHGPITPEHEARAALAKATA